MPGAFWDDVAEDVQDPEFARAYAAEAIRVRTIDSHINVPNDAAVSAGLSGSEIARAAGVQALEAREALEDTVDAREAAEVLARIESGQELTYTMAEVAAELGLTVE